MLIISKYPSGWITVLYNIIPVHLWIFLKLSGSIQAMGLVLHITVLALAGSHLYTWASAIPVKCLAQPCSSVMTWLKWFFGNTESHEKSVFWSTYLSWGCGFESLLKQSNWFHDSGFSCDQLSTVKATCGA